MFTTIMYGFINEVTRQPGSTALPQGTVRRNEGMKRRVLPRRIAAPAIESNPRRAPLPGQYRVLADSFRRAAGFL